MNVDSSRGGPGRNGQETGLERGRAMGLRDARRVAVLGAEGAVILALAWAFHIESPAFYQVVLPLAFGGAIVHHWLPIAYRPLFFGVLSLTGILVVLGWGAGTWLVGVGLALIALCHVPVPFRWRVVLIACAGSALVAMRSAWLPAPWPGVIWPILGSMFMFRLALYLYDLRHRGPAAPGFVLSYFFMLPNTVFLLFPVIDFQTFRRTYYDRPALDIYEEGIRWIFRGLTHLVLYRFIYHYVVLPPDAVASTADIVRYLVGTYGLYLRVSGTFHVIVGLLHLFGFRLPETHRFFYLASSFSDLWRRINIYWKDFMQKMVYLPVIFGLKRHGETTALMGATLSVIAATWFLHSYQWFWLLGTWFFTLIDVTFWAFLGTVLVVNTLWEQRKGRDRQLTTQTPAVGRIWREAIQTAGMFALMCVLWGYWSSPAVEDFRVVLGAFTLRGIDVAVVAGVLGVVTVAAFVSRRMSLGVPAELARPRWWQHPLVNAAVPLAVLWAVGEPVLAGHLPPQAQVYARQARAAELNEYDTERLTRGYYEQIVGVNRFNGELWEVYARAGTRQDADDLLFVDDLEGTADSGIWIRHDDALELTLRPRNETEFKGGRFSTNRWGMRDRDYERISPPGTRRIAVLGQSYTMGAGVNDGETFEALIEDRLNREWSERTGLRYEALNFAVSSYTLAKQALILQNGRVAEFRPDVLLVIGHPRDDTMILGDVVRLVRRGLLPAEPVAQWVREAGATKEMAPAEIRRRLQPRVGDLARIALENVASEARQMGAQPVYAIVPVPGDLALGAEDRLLSLAIEAGFLVISMQDVYAGRDPRLLMLSEADHHPNAEGHRMIAERLYRQLVSLPAGILAPDGPEDVSNRARVWAAWNSMQMNRAQAVEHANAVASAAAAIEGWEVETREGSVATLQSLREEDWMRVTITRNPHPAPSHVRLWHAPVPITNQRRYVLSFWMRADTSRPVGCGVARNAAPWVSLGDLTELEARRRWQEFTCAFTATGSEPNARILFDLGASDVAVELTAVVLRDVTTGRTVMSSASSATKEP